MLKDINDYIDWDSACYKLGLSLGIFTQPFLEVKHIFWADNPLGNMLFSMLEELVEQKILLRAGWKFKWNKDWNV